MTQKKTGLIVFIIVLAIIVVAALYIWIDYRNYEKRLTAKPETITLENAPDIYAKNENGDEIKLDVIGSSWVYNGNRTGEVVTNIEDLDKTYDESKENVYLADEKVVLYTKENVFFKNKDLQEYSSINGSNDEMELGSHSSGGDNGTEINVYMNQLGKNTVITQLNTEQGTIQTVFYGRVISNSDIYSLSNLSVANAKDIDMAMTKVPYSRFVKKYDFKNNKLTVYYDMQMEEYMQEDIAISLFTVFNDLKEVEINLDEATIKSVKTRDNNDQKYIDELNFTFTYDEINSNGLIEKVRQRVAR